MVQIPVLLLQFPKFGLMMPYVTTYVSLCQSCDRSKTVSESLAAGLAENFSNVASLGLGPRYTIHIQGLA